MGCHRSRSAWRVRELAAGSIRRGSLEGPLLGMLPVTVNGSWEDFREESIALALATGRDTLYVVFKNEANRGGLMNIDSLSFR